MNRLKALTIATSAALVAAIWLVPATALGQADAVMADTSVASEVIAWVMKIGFSILALLANWAVLKGIKYFEGKTKIDIPAQTEAMLFSWADMGIGLAKEKSHQAVKKGAGKLKGPEKLEIALGFVIDLAEEHGYKNLAENKIKDYIEAKLGLDRTEG